MIILDTNVISETIKQLANHRVVEWIDNQMAETFYLTTTSLSELLCGVEILPEGKRKADLLSKLNVKLVGFFGTRVLSFDMHAARSYAFLVAKARTNGCQISVPDGQIAAIARVHKFTVATRDTEPFVAAGVPVINPWSDG